jgi:hypothetical protein
MRCAKSGLRAMPGKTRASGISGASPGSVQAQIEKILSSDLFSNAGNLSRFLHFIVDQTLEGQGEPKFYFPLTIFATAFDNIGTGTRGGRMLHKCYYLANRHAIVNILAASATERLVLLVRRCRSNRLFIPSAPFLRPFLLRQPEPVLSEFRPRGPMRKYLASFDAIKAC